MKINDQPAQFTTPAEIRMVRLLPGPIERVWEFLTDPDKRARWFAGGTMEQKPGGKIKLQFDHASLSPDETPPAGHEPCQEAGMIMESEVLRCEPPHLLAYTFSTASEVTFELTTQGDQVQLVLTHRCTGEDISELCNYASGWHTHVGLLVALLTDTPAPPFWATHARLLAVYEKLRPNP